MAASWWEIIQNFNATIIVYFDGNERIVRIPLLPKAKRYKNYPKEEIRDFGEIRNLVLNYSNEEIPSLFQGIAVQRAGMTILRISVKADEALKKRIYGYCNFNEKLELELKKCELPNHMGFTIKRVWNHTREFIERKLEDFVLELSPKREKITADQRVLDEAAKLTNKLIEEYAPELSESEGPGRVPSEIYIESFFPNEKMIDFGETLEMFCTVINETQKKTKLSLLTKVFHCQSKENKFSDNYDIVLKGSDKQNIMIPEVNFTSIDKSGKYIAEAILRNKNEEIDRRRFDFCVNEEPPPVVIKSIRIESFRPNMKKIDYGETLIVDCSVVNETNNKENFIISIKIFHEGSGNRKYNENLHFELNGLSRKTIDIPLLDFDEKNDKVGKYIGEAILKSEGNSEEVDNKRFIFYVHEEPPKGKAFISKFVPALGKGLFFERWRNLPRNEKGLIHIVWDHPEFVRIREQARVKSKKLEGKEIMFYCVKCGTDEAMRRLLELRYNEKKLTSDELKEIRRIHNELIYAAHLSLF